MTTKEKWPETCCETKLPTSRSELRPGFAVEQRICPQCGEVYTNVDNAGELEIERQQAREAAAATEAAPDPSPTPGDNTSPGKTPRRKGNKAN